MGRTTHKNAIKDRMRVILNGKRWFIWFVLSKDIPSDRYGDCGYSGSTPTIRVRRALQGRMALNVLIHEVLHAARPELAEEAVTETANDIEKVLWRRGYRLIPKESPKKSSD